jgi:hypothetical protein
MRRTRRERVLAPAWKRAHKKGQGKSIRRLALTFILKRSTLLCFALPSSLYPKYRLRRCVRYSRIVSVVADWQELLIGEKGRLPNRAHWGKQKRQAPALESLPTFNRLSPRTLLPSRFAAERPATNYPLSRALDGYSRLGATEGCGECSSSGLG